MDILLSLIALAALVGGEMGTISYLFPNSKTTDSLPPEDNRENDGISDSPASSRVIDSAQGPLLLPLNGSAKRA